MSIIICCLVVALLYYVFEIVHLRASNKSKTLEIEELKQQNKVSLEFCALFFQTFRGMEYAFLKLKDKHYLIHQDREIVLIKEKDSEFTEAEKEFYSNPATFEYKDAN